MRQSTSLVVENKIYLKYKERLNVASVTILMQFALSVKKREGP